MGHTYAEMHVQGEETFHQRYSDYQQACAREISRIIKRNPIKDKDIQIGDRVELYEPLRGLSKVRFENRGECNKIRELFAPTAQYFSMNMWALAYEDLFEVWNKREVIQHVGKREETSHFIRIDEPPKPFRSMTIAFDWNPHWVEIKYFSKKS